MPGSDQCPVPLTSPCTAVVNTLITTFRSSHFATVHPKASEGHVTVDPTPFLSAVVTVSAALVAIIGGLLVAKFVGLDADQRASRKILTDARERLRLAQGRERTAWRAILRSDAGRFFVTPWVIDAIVDEGVVSPAELIRMASWSHDPDELTPFVTEVADEAGQAREAITPRIRSDDASWSDFRRRNPDLPEVCWRGHGSTSSAASRKNATQQKKQKRKPGAGPRRRGARWNAQRTR